MKQFERGLRKHNYVAPSIKINASMLRREGSDEKVRYAVAKSPNQRPCFANEQRSASSERKRRAPNTDTIVQETISEDPELLNAALLFYNINLAQKVMKSLEINMHHKRRSESQELNRLGFTDLIKGASSRHPPEFLNASTLKDQPKHRFQRTHTSSQKFNPWHQLTTQVDEASSRQTLP